MIPDEVIEFYRGLTRQGGRRQHLWKGLAVENSPVLPVPGVDGLFLHYDGGIALALPQELWREINGGCCCCACVPRNPADDFTVGRLPLTSVPAWWDTLRLHPDKDHPWTVHWPELQTWLSVNLKQEAA